MSDLPATVAEDVSALKNPGFHIVNPGRATRQATLIVVGVPRSGTSMVASVLHELGVPLGRRADRAVFEDIEIAHAMESNNQPALIDIINRQNGLHDVWGFKRPLAYRYISKFRKLFRAPRFVVVFRDPASIAKRNQISMLEDYLEMLKFAAAETLELTDFVCRTKEPMLLCSYEKALADPAAFIEALAAFSGVSPDAEGFLRAEAAVRNGPEAYLDSSRVKFEGRLDDCQNGIATGWARRVPGRGPVTVEIRHRGQVIGSGIANLARPDLHALNMGDVAFAIPLNRPLAREEIAAFFTETDIEIAKSRFAQAGAQGRGCGSPDT